MHKIAFFCSLFFSLNVSAVHFADIVKTHTYFGTDHHEVIADLDNGDRIIHTVFLDLDAAHTFYCITQGLLETRENAPQEWQQRMQKEYCAVLSKHPTRRRRTYISQSSSCVQLPDIASL